MKLGRFQIEPDSGAVYEMYSIEVHGCSLFTWTVRYSVNTAFSSPLGSRRGETYQLLSSYGASESDLFFYLFVLAEAAVIVSREQF
jgi:hypothetical protein